MNSSTTQGKEGTIRPWKDRKKKFEKLWLKKTGDCSNIQNGGDKKIQISNGTVEPIQTTTTYSRDSNNICQQQQPSEMGT